MAAHPAEPYKSSLATSISSSPVDSLTSILEHLTISTSMNDDQNVPIILEHPVLPAFGGISTPDRSSRSITDFHVFPRLPIELRTYIFDLALRNWPPQVITVTLARVEEIIEDDPSDGEAPYCGLRYEVEKCWGLYTIPVLLQVNIESRERALRVYRPCFEDCFIFPIYFDTARDTLFLDSCSTLTAFKYFKLTHASLQCLKEIENLAIGGLVALFYKCISDRRFLSKFESLETLLLERGETDKYWLHNDSEERAALRWFKECWTKPERVGAQHDEGEDMSKGAAVVAGPMVRFITPSEMESLGMRTIARISVEQG